jgi:acyl-CoA thioester hydrolase
VHQQKEHKKKGYAYFFHARTHKMLQELFTKLIILSINTHFMNEYLKIVEIRWADLDPNFHLRHSVYYDYGAYCRVSFLEEYGLSNLKMQELSIGPILFREEAVFRREIRLGDRLSINLALAKARTDYSRWTIRHELIKNQTILAAVITVEGAWLHTLQRKLATPPPEVAFVFEQMPKTEQFEWLGH